MSYTCLEFPLPPHRDLPRILCLVCSHYRKQIVLLQELTAGRVTEEVGTTAYRVVRKELISLLITKILQRIRPQQITHGSIGWRLPEAIQLATRRKSENRKMEKRRKQAKQHWQTIVNISARHSPAKFITVLMSSSVKISGERPPCMHRNCWFSSAARGRQSNASMQAS